MNIVFLIECCADSHFIATQLQIPHCFSYTVSTLLSFSSRVSWRDTAGGRGPAAVSSYCLVGQQNRKKSWCGVLPQLYAQSSWTLADLEASSWQWPSHGLLDIETGDPKASCPSQCPISSVDPRLLPAWSFPWASLSLPAPAQSLEGCSSLPSDFTPVLTWTN